MALLPLPAFLEYIRDIDVGLLHGRGAGRPRSVAFQESLPSTAKQAIERDSQRDRVIAERLEVRTSVIASARCAA